MSIRGTTKTSVPLTNIAQTYPVGNMIGKIVAPVKSVMKYADTVYNDGDDAIDLSNDLAENAQSNGIDFSNGTPYTYRTTRKALHANLLDKTMDNEDDIVKSKIRETKKLTHRLLLRHEKRVADILTDNSIVTQTAALSGTDRWDNASFAENWEKKMITAIKTIKDNCGCNANTIVVPFDAGLYLANMSFVKDIKYQWSMELLQGNIPNQVMALIGLPPFIKGLRVVVSDGRVNNANEGVTASKGLIWGTNCLIGYVPPSVEAEDTYGLLTMEYEPFKVQEERETDPDGIKIITSWDYDLMQADLATWYLYTTVIS